MLQIGRATFSLSNVIFLPISLFPPICMHSVNLTKHCDLHVLLFYKLFNWKRVNYLVKNTCGKRIFFLLFRSFALSWKIYIWWFPFSNFPFKKWSGPIDGCDFSPNLFYFIYNWRLYVFFLHIPNNKDGWELCPFYNVGNMIHDIKWFGL